MSHDHSDAGLVRLPAASLAELAERCSQLGDDGITALREVGRGTGARLFTLLGDRPDALSIDDFWSGVNGRLENMRFGSVEPAVIDHMLGSVRWTGSPESAATTRRSVGCHFATGLLGGLLGRAADQPVAVLEVGCRAGGADVCRFVFGSVPRVADVYTQLAAGTSIEAALER